MAAKVNFMVSGIGPKMDHHLILINSPFPSNFEFKRTELILYLNVTNVNNINNIIHTKIF